MSQQKQLQENQMNANNNRSSDNPELEVLEQGDIYFFYRPKKDAEQIKGIEDVRRFFMVTGPEKSENTKENSDKSQFYRLFVITSTESLQLKRVYSNSV